ncbi:MAG: indole-3-glycerol phosphate synthase, partial [Chloroflexota bacterium]|nr:indole-3-glycerol phosphate synthase [Chloroflexota bacterium]
MTVLDELLAASRVRAGRDARLVPLRELRREVGSMPPARRFEAAIRYGDRLALIAEVKRASPSAGSFKAVEDVRAFAQAYIDGGATALSVLTEPTRFAGSDPDLRDLSSLGVPVLRK